MRLDAVNLKKGDTLVVTINSDEMDKELVKSIKKELKKAFPKNRVAIFGLAKDDNLSISVLNQGERK